jgi:hypothetical protein
MPSMTFCLRVRFWVDEERARQVLKAWMGHSKSTDEQGKHGDCAKDIDHTCTVWSQRKHMQ